MEQLPVTHFLSLPRPGPTAPVALIPGGVDTSTLAAHDFDVDTRTGFMPPQPPLARLPAQYAVWEDLLGRAVEGKLQLGSTPGLTGEDAARSWRWREDVETMPTLDTTTLTSSELLLRRAHHVLAWIMHVYIHTLPLLPSSSDVPPPSIVIPRSLSIPHLAVCAELQLPPVLTYSDDVLYNWKLPTPDGPITPESISVVTTFTGTNDEAEFYLASARIELQGVRALALMRRVMDEAFVGDATALNRITSYLNTLASVIAELSNTLLAVRAGCDPDVFYNAIRPWFKGEDSSASGRKWIFEGVSDDQQPAELSGPSAGQSTLVHALDIFLGVDQYSHAPALTGKSSNAPTTSPQSHSGDVTSAPAHKSKPFLDRMQVYMPRHHRAFLQHLSAQPRPLRALVNMHTSDGANPALREAYNFAVQTLKGFRDAHMRIVALYIVGPARRAAGEEERGRWLGQEGEQLKGTGGTELVRFLKGVRDRTASAVLEKVE